MLVRVINCRKNLHSKLMFTKDFYLYTILFIKIFYGIKTEINYDVHLTLINGDLE